jgi:hypothetical protein
MDRWDYQFNNIAQMLGNEQQNLMAVHPQVGWKCHQQHLCCGHYNRNMTIRFHLEIHTTDNGELGVPSALLQIGRSGRHNQGSGDF